MKINPEDITKSNIIIDVRTPAEYRAKHIPKSFNIPLQDIKTYSKKLSKIDNLVFVCRTDRRSTQACSMIDADAQVIEGGIQAWEQAGRKLEIGKSIWALDRQVRFSAGTLVTIGVLLGTYVNAYWMILPAFVGIGLAYSGISDSCMMAKILSKLPFNNTDHNTKEVIKKLQNNT